MPASAEGPSDGVAADATAGDAPALAAPVPAVSESDASQLHPAKTMLEAADLVVKLSKEGAKA